MNDSLGMPDKIHRLAIRQIEGTLSDEGRAELVTLLAGAPAARRAYLEHMQDTASLRWMFSGHLSRKTALTLAERGPEGLRAARRRRAAWWALATAVALACVAALPFLLPGKTEGNIAAKQTSAPQFVATITDLADVKWATTDGSRRRLSRVAVGDEFEFTAGTLELAFDTYAKVQVFGPAKFRVSDSKSIACTRGRVTTQVEEGGKGFTIDTPKARIVDLGTQFGVDISETGDTQVVVFRGSVDLTKAAGEADQSSAEADPWTRTLEQGDALLLDHTGAAQRLMAVQRGDFFPPNVFDHYGRRRRAPLILDVHDNIRGLESTKCYQIVWGGMREDAPSFVDREHQWNGRSETGIPEFLLGADYIMPFNDDKFMPDLQVEVKLARPATCYVFFDDNMPRPEWLLRDFEDTGFDIALDGAKTQWHKGHDLGVGAGESVDFPFSIWRRDIPEGGAVIFGGVQPPKDKKRSAGFNMYGIAVAPKM